MSVNIYKTQYIPRPYKPLHIVPNGWITLKVFRANEAERLHCSLSHVHSLMYSKNHYPDLEIQRINKRVVFVKMKLNYEKLRQMQP